MSDPEFLDVVHDVIAGASPTPASSTDRARAKWKLLSRTGPFATSADLCDVWAGNTRDVSTLTPRHFDDLVASIASVGQQVPVIARVSRTDPERLEVIAGACRLAAIRQLNETRASEEQLPITVELRELDDEQALKVVDAENRARSDMSRLEKARFYARAIESIYHTETALAEVLGLHKSTVNRTLAITRLPQEVFGLIKNPHSISAAQASDFMADWNEPRLRDTLIDQIDELSANGPVSAAAVFKALQQAVAPSAGPAPVIIVHEGAELGSIRRTKNGGVVIELGAEAGTLGWKSVAQATGAALKQLGPPSEQ